MVHPKTGIEAEDPEAERRVQSAEDGTAHEQTFRDGPNHRPARARGLRESECGRLRPQTAAHYTDELEDGGDDQRRSDIHRAGPRQSGRGHRHRPVLPREQTYGGPCDVGEDVGHREDGQGLQK